MNARYLPPIIALAALAASYAIWLPIRSDAPEPPTIPPPILPAAAELPELMDETDHITVFESSKNKLKKGPISITRESSHNKGRDRQYRLRAYIGGNGLWVVTLEDESGKFCTIKNGELIPHTKLEFKGMEFHASSNGLSEGTAVFYDQSSSNYVDVVAYSEKDAAPANNTPIGSVQ